MDSSHQLSNLVSQRHDVKHLEVAADEPIGHDLQLDLSGGVAPNEEVGPGEPWGAWVVKLTDPVVVMTIACSASARGIPWRSAEPLGANEISATGRT
jgi:hypothetical protein